MRDPYKVLGVKRDAGADEIKAAWRNLAKAVHPDHNIGDPTATERFAEIGRAYETLKDPQKRSRYDQVARMAEAKGQSTEQTIMQQRQAAREAAERAKAARANAEKIMEELARANAQKAQKAASAANPQAAGAESPEDMVERIFGAKAARAAPNQAETAASAAETEKPREPESGETEENFAEEEQLATGTGSTVFRSRFGILGSLVRRFTGGSVQDKVPEKTPEIAAEATVTLDDMLKGNWIAVPLSDGREARFQATTDISNGQVVHLKGQGMKLQGMLRGDVAITIHLSTDSRFTLNGLDVHTTLPVTIENAVLGYETTVEGLSGPVRLTVPPWSGSDQVIRISDQGLPDGHGGKGNLVVELRLMLWEKPDDKVTDLMRSMREGLFL
ncbi:DnaJ domain-containing protein [Rhizobium sp. CB3171]|uniref:DnaJ domain-containing protein n=1 Tax=unclassified Rhizobium TaxID=2613769 RepID=UPI000CDF3F0F|nr:MULTISPECIES: DnaJ domain-containing protein [Rhizobium]AVA20580.1 DnaJ family heat shock protein [Rhizobium sp. NXC24]UWU23225.1 DnaJ domain-containing protein [Rhizobium tropici]WFU04000.1 DnaJ domain-containing protein [Rhizobium sp. CB3171]